MSVVIVGIRKALMDLDTLRLRIEYVILKNSMTSYGKEVARVYNV